MNSRGTTGSARSVDESDLVAIAVIVDDLLDSASEAAADAIWEQVPAYRDHPDPVFRQDVVTHCRHVFHAFAVSLREQRSPLPEDFPLTSENAMRRVEQDISLADFLQAFRVGQLSLWESILSAIGDDQHMRDALLGAVAQLMKVIEVGSYSAASAYLEAEQYRLADHDRVRRDLVEDLLGDRAPLTAPRRALLRSAGLGSDAALVVVSAAPTRTPDDEQGLRPAASLIRRAIGREARGLLALRQSEIVGVFPVTRSTNPLTAGLERARTELSTGQLPFTFGVSTTHSGIREIAAAYREACLARDSRRDSSSVVVLSSVSAFDYLTLGRDPTAVRLISPQIRAFVEEDLTADSTYIDTLIAYVECDLNAKATAKRLQLHVNTAYYRLERIEERTGCDLRRFSEVADLLVAVRLLHPAAPRRQD